jgi:hypothetical protein
MYKGIVALNATWLEQMDEFIDRSNAAYGRESSDILSLKEKEKISYNFSTLQQLDNYWGHAQDIVVRATPSSEPVYTYDPHYWFYLARPTVEKAHIALTNSLGKQFFMTVGGNTPLDRVLQKDFDDEMKQYHMEQIFDKSGYYCVVVGNYIFEARFDAAVEKIIESIYAKHRSLTSEARSELGRIPAIVARTKLRITKNSTRARKLKSLLSKNFFVRKTN